jgi:hypothetical protein
VNIPGTDDWYIVYHRINKNYLSNGPGYHREVCIDRLTFADDGTINQVQPTHQGITPVDVSQLTDDLLTGVAQLEKPCYVRSRTDAVYDLQGRRVQISSGQKGVYITAGRKIVVR